MPGCEGAQSNKKPKGGQSTWQGSMVRGIPGWSPFGPSLADIPGVGEDKRAVLDSAHDLGVESRVGGKAAMARSHPSPSHIGRPMEDDAPVLGCVVGGAERFDSQGRRLSEPPRSLLYSPLVTKGPMEDWLDPVLFKKCSPAPVRQPDRTP